MYSFKKNRKIFKTCEICNSELDFNDEFNNNSSNYYAPIFPIKTLNSDENEQGLTPTICPLTGGGYVIVYFTQLLTYVAYDKFSNILFSDSYISSGASGYAISPSRNSGFYLTYVDSTKPPFKIRIVHISNNGKEINNVIASNDCGNGCINPSITTLSDKIVVAWTKLDTIDKVEQQEFSFNLIPIGMKISKIVGPMPKVSLYTNFDKLTSSLITLSQDCTLKINAETTISVNSIDYAFASLKSSNTKIITWVDTNNDGYYRCYNDNGIIKEEKFLNGNCYQVKVCGLSKDEFVIIYIKENFKLFANFYDNNCNLIDRILISDMGTFCDLNVKSIICLLDNTFIITWTENKLIKYCRYIKTTDDLYI